MFSRQSAAAPSAIASFTGTAWKDPATPSLPCAGIPEDPSVGFFCVVCHCLSHLKISGLKKY
jgi:hypothetical protein